jgi:deoxyribonuclease V
MRVDVQALQQWQRQQATQIVLQDDFVEPVNWIGGADVGFEAQGSITRAVIVVLHYPSWHLVEYQVARVPTTLPYIPGLLAFREYPGLLAAWRHLQHLPQLLLVDGQGIAHPRRLGIASHFGLLAQVPTIGIAKRRLFGRLEPVGEEHNAVVPLWDGIQQLGWGWRSKKRCRPLLVSPGHRVSLTTALLWAQRCSQGYRLPEPIRWADAIASKRPLAAGLPGSL